MAVFVSLLGVIRTSCLPEQEFLASTIIDDAIYNLVPAQNLINGHGYSFDKIHRTNGVQPAWAGFALLITTVCADRVSATRLLVFAGSLFWLASGVVLFCALRSAWPAVALVGGVLWLFTGFTQRLAMQGMENGLTGFCLALSVWIGVKYLYRQESPGRRFYLFSGVVAALVSLCRVEMVILAALMTVAALFGLFDKHRSSGLQWRNAIVMCFPTVLCFGAYVLINLFYFGGLVPVSGAAKQFYNQEWLKIKGWPFGGFYGNLRFQFGYPWAISTFAISGSAEMFLSRRFGVGLGSASLQAVWNVFCLAGVAVGLFQFAVGKGRNALLELVGSPWRRFCLVLLVFVFAHHLLLVLFNPYFTLYGTWYFSPQLMVCVCVCGLAAGWLARGLGSLMGRLGPLNPVMFEMSLILALACGLVVVNLHWRLGVTVADTRPSMLLTFRRAGEWMNARLPGVQRIATISSGFVNYFARRHHVFNLDGLMNDYRYLYEYLRRNRVPEYLKEQKIEYFGDYAPVEKWRDGIGWGGHVPVSGMELLRWWIVPDGVSAYAIWRLHPPGKTRDVLDPCTAPCDGVSQIQFAAMVLKRYAVVEDAELEAYRRTHPDAVVATSVWPRVGARLRHVMMSRSEYRSLRSKLADVDIASRLNVTFAGSLELLGFEAVSWSVARGGEFVYSRHWRVLQRPPNGDLTVDVYINPRLPGWFWHRERGVHGTFPVSEWEPGDVITETYLLPVPLDIPPGVYPVRLGLWDASTGWQPNDGARDPSGPGMVIVGNLEVR